MANRVLPGLGYVLAFLVAIGGLAFNIGNIGGVALGLNALLGLPEKLGALIAGCLGITIFLNKNAKTIMDKLATTLAGIILLTVTVVAVESRPPLGVVAGNLVQVEQLFSKDMFLALTTLLGGSCGGYIAFSGVHRLLDAGISGPENVHPVRRSVLLGCCTSGVVRILLFLAVLGTCMVGTRWLPAKAQVITDAVTGGNPAAEVFRLAAGEVGYRLFGLCLSAAGISSLVGAAFTPVSCLKTLHPFIEKHEHQFVVGFITCSTLMTVATDNTARLIIIAGSLNGLILPLSLGTMLLACRNKKIVGDSYKHPVWMILTGVIVVAISLYVGFQSVPELLSFFQ